jgi:hypothetical protein
MRITVNLISGGLLAIGFSGVGEAFEMRLDGVGEAFEMRLDGHAIRAIIENIRKGCASAMRDHPVLPAGYAPGVEINFVDPAISRGWTVVTDVGSWQIIADELDRAAAIAARGCAQLSSEVGHA